MFDPIKIQRLMNRGFKIEVVAVAIALLITAGLFVRVFVLHQTTETTSAASQVRTEITTTSQPLPTPTLAPTPTPTPTPYVVSEQLAAVMALNPDTCGWLKVSNTRIDQPVVCGIDNDFYLKHDYLGQKDIAGAIFQDFRNAGQWAGRHSIIYGHNMKNGTMFHDLRYFKDQTFAMENNRIQLETRDGLTEWQIFSSYVMTTDFYVIQTDFEDDAEYQAFLETLLKKSQFDYGIDVDQGQNILTMMTCSYEVDNARFVIHAVQVE